LQFVFRCECGFSTESRATLEAAGREADLHMAQMYPTPTQRRPCPPAVSAHDAGLGGLGDTNPRTNQRYR
jgi:hypothetical protein